jgi:CDGSH-type Zn-finger protein
LWEAATLPNEHSGEAEAYWIGGTYDVRVRREAGRWLFSKVELKLNMATPASENWVRKRFPDGNASQPYFMNLEAGTTYYWCKCGAAETQPLCDASHICGKSAPTAFTVEESGLQAVCGCRYSKTRPLCDGSHLNLKFDYALLGKDAPARITAG